MKAGINQIQSYVPEEPVQRVKSKYHLKRLARLSANENPYGTSPLVKEALINAINDGALNRYPDGDASELRALVGQQLNVAGDQLVFGVGLDEIIELVARAFLTPDDQVVVAKPAFSEYALHDTVEEAAVKEVPVNPATGHFDFAVMPVALAAILQKIRLPYNLNTLAQVAAAKNAVERAKWEDFFDQQGVKYFKSQANFIYFTVKNADELAQALLEKGFQVRHHLQPDWLRLTIGPAEDTTVMQALVADWLKQQA